MVELVLTTDLVTPHEIFLRLTFGRRLKLRGVCGHTRQRVRGGWKQSRRGELERGVRQNEGTWGVNRR